MRYFLGWTMGVFAVVTLAACEEAKPSLTGRLVAPVDLEVFKGCPQQVPTCDLATDAKHLLLIVNSLGNDLRIFEAEGRAFFKAPNPLFPLTIPVGEYPRAIALDPNQEFAFVVNAISQDISVVDLAPDHLVEVDTDWDSCTSFCGSCNDPDRPDNDWCQAGISRVGFGDPDALVEPEQIATPRPEPLPGAPAWDRTTPLPVYVSLAASGQLAVLEFSYPAPTFGRAQRLQLLRLIDVGGRPSGLAITPDGQWLFAADELSDSIVALETATDAVTRIRIGGPSRRLALAPDNKVLYVLGLEDARISLVDVATLAQRAPGESRLEAIDPETAGQDILLPGIARAITFVKGPALGVQDEVGISKDWSSELLTSAELKAKQEEDPEYKEHTVRTFAYVSVLNGNTFILDAENHRAVDITPFKGASVEGDVFLRQAGESAAKTPEELLTCLQDASCLLPMLAEFDKTYDGDTEKRTIYSGVTFTTGVTRSESWVITWEGVIKGTATSSTASFDAFQLVDPRPGLSFVDQGVEAGDILEITSDPPPAAEGLADDPCVSGVGTGYPPTERPVNNEFTITAVDPDALTLQAVAGVEPQSCWSQVFSYRVRAHDAWTVWGSETGSMGRVQMVPRQSPPPDPPVYDNGLIAFTLFEPGVDPDTGERAAIKRDTTWAFNSLSGFGYAAFAPSISAGISGAIRYVDLDETDDDTAVDAPNDDRVYLLFEGSNALMEFFPQNLDPSNFYLFQ